MKKIILFLTFFIAFSSFSPSISYNNSPIIKSKNIKIKVGDNIYSFFSKNQLEDMYNEAIKNENVKLEMLKFQNSHKQFSDFLCFGIYDTDDDWCYINLKQGKSMANVVYVKRKLISRYAYLYNCLTGEIYHLNQIS
jgi:hypothetical protein